MITASRKIQGERIAATTAIGLTYHDLDDGDPFLLSIDSLPLYLTIHMSRALLEKLGASIAEILAETGDDVAAAVAEVSPESRISILCVALGCVSDYDDFDSFFVPVKYSAPIGAYDEAREIALAVWRQAHPGPDHPGGRKIKGVDLTEDHDLDPVGGHDIETATVLRSKTHDAEVVVNLSHANGEQRYEIHYREPSGKRLSITGDWSKVRKNAIDRMRKLVANGDVAERRPVFECARCGNIYKGANLVVSCHRQGCDGPVREVRS